MPVVLNLAVSMSPEDAAAIPGLTCRGAISQRVETLIPEVLDQIKVSGCMRPAIAYESLDITDKQDGEIVLKDGSRLSSPLVAHRLKRASRLVFGAATVGGLVDSLISDLVTSGNALKALITENIANACLLDLSQQFHQIVDRDAESDQLQSSGFLAPGDGGFAIEHQRQVLELAGADRLSIKLSSNSMMTPRHSVTKVLGVGRKMRKWTQAETCAECAARDRCPHRQAVSVPSI